MNHIDLYHDDDNDNNNNNNIGGDVELTTFKVSSSSPNDKRRRKRSTPALRTSTSSSHASKSGRKKKSSSSRWEKTEKTAKILMFDNSMHRKNKAVLQDFKAAFNFAAPVSGGAVPRNAQWEKRVARVRDDA
jgi:hypothetical protein